MSNSGEITERDQKLADVCGKYCTVCKAARKKEGGFWYKFVKLEAKLCPMCRAYQKVYGVPAWEKPPAS